MNTIAKREAIYAQSLLEKYKRGGFRDGTRPVISIDTLKGIDEGNIKLADRTLYIRAAITGQGGDFRFLKHTTDQKDGTVNIDKGRLPEHENHFFGRVIVGYAKSTPETDPALVNFSSVVNTGNLPLALQNAELIIKQESRLLVQQPIAAILSEQASEYPRGSEEVGFNLAAVQYLVAQSQIECILRMPSDQSIPSDPNYHIELMLPGISTVPR